MALVRLGILEEEVRIMVARGVLLIVLVGIEAVAVMILVEVATRLAKMRRLTIGSRYEIWSYTRV